jgi:hypothetical protein
VKTEDELNKEFDKFNEIVESKRSAPLKSYEKKLQLTPQSFTSNM